MNPIDIISQSLQTGAEYAKSQFGKDLSSTEKASPIDLVTATDLALHETISEMLKKASPLATIISEEDTGNHDVVDTEEFAKGEFWILDPIDGTNNFASHIPLFGIMLAHITDGVIDAAGSMLPMQDELYLAEKEKGVFCNGKQISCSKKEHWSYTFGCSSASLSPNKTQLRNFITHAWEKDKFWLSCYGCAAVSGAYVAAGRRDWCVSMGSKIWDYAPIYLLMKEAGCVITNFDGKPWQMSDRTLVAAPQKLHESLMELIEESRK